MKASSFLATKYLFSKTKFNIVSIISVFSITVLTLAYFSFFTILSVFSGLEKYSLTFSKSFDPDLKIYSKNDKFFKLEKDDLKFLSETFGDKFFSKVVTGNVLVQYNGATAFAKILGVDENFENIIAFSEIISVGKYKPLKKPRSYTSYSISEKLDLTLFNSSGSFSIYSINGSYPENLSNPFKKSVVLFSDGIFTSRNNENENIIVCSIDVAQFLFELKENTFSEIIIKNASNHKDLKKILKTRFDSLIIKSHNELNETLYKMMKSEKLIVTAIMIMIVILSVFNIIGAVIMLIVEKEFDIRSLKILGMTKADLEIVFFKNGMLINLIGLIIGLFLSIIIVFIQLKFSIVKVGSLELAYPVQFNFSNLITVIFTALLVGAISSYISSKAVKKLV